MKKRISALLLALLMLSAACAKGTNEAETEKTEVSPVAESPASDSPAEEAGAAESETELYDNLPAVTYGGADVTIWGDTAEYDVFYDAELTGDVVNDAVFQRNVAVSDRFDVKLTYDLTPTGWRNQRDLINSVTAGTSAYDLTLGVCCYLSQTALAGCLANLAAMEYIELDQPWYMQFINDNILLGDRLYFAAGFYDMPTVARTLVTFYSTELAEQFGVGNLYDTVREGKWTFDYMMTLSEGVLSDVDGNGVYDEHDRYGITSQWDSIGFLYPSTGYSYVTFDGEGGVASTQPTEAVYEANELLYRLLYQSDYYYSGYTKDGPHNYENMRYVFTDNRALFFINYVFNTQLDELREMGTYGILTIPKLREDQERYGTVSSFFDTGIPIDAPDQEMSAILLEALESESWRRVRPAYYEVALSKKYVNDPDSIEMLDLVFENVHCDFSYVYNGGWGDLPLSVGLNENYASWYEKHQSSFDKMLQKTLDKVLKFDD